VERFLDLVHDGFVVVAQMDYAGARGAHLRDIDVGARVAVEGCQCCAHVYAVLWGGGDGALVDCV